MQHSEFVKNWGFENKLDKLLRFPPLALSNVKIDDDSRNFLIKCGLPDSAAPCLNFQLPKNGFLPTVSQDWSLPENYSSYRVIGFNGSGDPICLDENDIGAVVYLNHDQHFKRILMNSSVMHLASSLLIFRSYVKNGTTVEAEVECLKELQKADEAAWQQSNFWRYEILMMRE